MEYDVKVANRLKRIEGQLRAVRRMMDEGEDCKSIITQLSAVRSGVDRAIGVVVTENLVQCMQETLDEGEKNELVKQAMDLVIKSR
ncbi:metal-sensitive transcriptional regulator [Caryophanon tenue]|uniref:Cytoplasmic protein n=1 Tax=Caryophanon tenue TaxID=33978 RepID=A0A1C0YCX1_9BACL|nr:metal-sensitive transcriptional regulator [Caryophanon tenue]OCS85027.1 cytoplasmic protein [Caryophanon tenue]